MDTTSFALVAVAVVAIVAMVMGVRRRSRISSHDLEDRIDKEIRDDD